MTTLLQPIDAVAKTASELGYEVVAVEGGWIVGSYNDQGKFDQLLPHGELIPYRTNELANKAMLLLASLNS